MCRKVKLARLASKMVRHSSSSASSTSASSSTPNRHTLTPTPSAMAPPGLLPQAATLDPAYPLSQEEVQHIKEACGILDNGFGTPTDDTGLAHNNEGAKDGANEDFRTLNADGTRGGLLTAWNSALFDCLDKWVGSYSLNVLLRRKIDGKEFWISNIYGPTSADLKADFFNELLAISERTGEIWTALGDFNVLLSLHDKNGSATNVDEILKFRRVVNEIGLIDLPLLNRTYTWTNGRRNPTLERLDRAFISQGWFYSFPRSALRALPRPRSDHTPLVLSAYTFVPSSSLFRFESYWLRYPSFNEELSRIGGPQSPFPGSMAAHALTFQFFILHSRNEVKRAVFDSAPEKAPGPDGFPALFYQRFWSLIKNDIMMVFTNFYNGSDNLEGVNSSWLCLIPKKSNVNFASDYRPISLAAFTRGRHILDNFYGAHILIHDLYSTKQQAALLKLDFERAFDNINWAFLTNLLQREGSAIGGLAGFLLFNSPQPQRCFLMVCRARLSPANEGSVREILYLRFSLIYVSTSFLECCKWLSIRTPSPASE
uniref:Reverse transcriptase domain-containing protein n=1 Tax=Ananas comosus var. bracteatus TaxID=296719 RepID=A0A6V7Q598_ANACO|nr:unnamed protein product [Ananas comosus var. bracteatus]